MMRQYKYNRIEKINREQVKFILKILMKYLVTISITCVEMFLATKFLLSNIERLLEANWIAQNGVAFLCVEVAFVIIYNIFIDAHYYKAYTAYIEDTTNKELEKEIDYKSDKLGSLLSGITLVATPMIVIVEWSILAMIISAVWMCLKLMFM